MNKLKTNWKFYLFAILILILIPVHYAVNNYMSSTVDTLYMLSTGKYILESGIPHINPFSIDSDLHFICQNWLSSVIYYLLYSAFDIFGILFFNVVFILLAVFLMYKLIYKKMQNQIVSVILASILMIFTEIPGAMKTNISSVALLLLELYLLEKYRDTNNNKWLFVLPLITLFEINTHASFFVFYFILLLPYIVPAIKNPIFKFKENSYKIKPLLLIMIPMFLSGFLNPYGWSNITYFIKSYTAIHGSTGQIEELASIAPFSVWGIILISIILIVLFFSRKQTVDSAHLYLFLGCMILTFGAYRNLLFLTIGLPLVVADLLKNNKFMKIRYKIDCITLAALCVIIGILYQSIELSSFKSDETIYTPYSCLNYLNEQEDVKLYCEFRTAGFFALNDYKILMDSRPELYTKIVNKKVDIFNRIEYIEDNSLDKTREYITTFIDEYNFNYFCVLNSTTMNQYLKNNDQYEKINLDESLYYSCYKRKE